MRRETLRALTLSPAALERAVGGTWQFMTTECDDSEVCHTLGTGSKYCPQM